MRKISKRFLPLFMAVVMVLGGIPAVYAAVQEGLSVEIITDKESYSKGEEAKVTLKLTNAGNVGITNIEGEIKLPDGIVLSKECSTTIKLDSLAAGTNQEVVLEGKVSDDKVVTGDSAVNMIVVFLLVAAGAGAGFVVCRKKNVKNIANVCVVVLVLAVAGLIAPTVANAATEKTVKAEKTIKIDGKEAVITAEVKYTAEGTETGDNNGSNTGDNSGSNTGDNNGGNTGDNNGGNTGDNNGGNTGDNNGGNTGDNNQGETEPVNHVTVHDPSIVKDTKTGTYYVFGSHMAWAKSTDLKNWTTFTNNINRDYKTLFADAATWSAKGGNQGKPAYDVSGNLWAPDVIWNEDMGKWCMYMSVNGDKWYTSIVLLTADSLEGDWTVVGPVVYSGFTSKADAELTDFYYVHQGTDFPDRYLENRNGNRTYGMNAIDPCVFYDEDGKLWMAYGSWFGGIYMIELDSETGLRDYKHVYGTVENVSDEYQGIKLAGGQHVSGEAAYIEHIGDDYYLYVTLGGLTSDGGYNMRVFRSADVCGPYVDISGDSAVYTSATNNINGKVGVRLMSYYKWDYMDYGYVAQGHNSAFLDDNGKAYIFYHTRFDNQGEGHQVRVHQIFINEDGWQVAAPFEYSGETLAAVEKSEVVGAYSVLVHEGTDYANKECVQSINIGLSSDGTVTGDKTGTWKFSDTKGSPYVTLTLGGKEYKGVFVEQKMEESSQVTMTFTVVGSTDELSVWGYRLAGSDEKLAKEAADALTMPIGALGDITLPSTGLNATAITWASSNTAVLGNDGKVTAPDTDTTVKLTATVKYGEATVTKDFDVKVFAERAASSDLVLWTYYTESAQNLTSAVKGTNKFANPFNKNNIAGLTINNGVSIKFHVKADSTGARDWEKDILSFNSGAVGGLFIMDKSYVGYNATGGFFDANMRNGSYAEGAWSAGTNFIGDEADVEIKFLPYGFEYWVNGTKVYDNSNVPSDTVPGQINMTNYLSLLTYLNETATDLNFGWGSFWDGGFNGTISNVQMIALGAEETDLEGNLYYEKFNLGAGSLINWTSHANDSGSLSAGFDDAHGYFLKYYAPSQRGNRCVYTLFDSDVQLSGKYTIEADIMLNAGSDKDSQFVILGTDATYAKLNGKNDPNKTVGVESGYILKLDTSGMTTTCTVAGTDETVTIAKDTWTHIKVTVDDSGNVIVKIGDQKVVTKVDGAGKLGGIYALAARKTGLFAIDNIKINNATEEELKEFEDIADGGETELTYTSLADYSFLNSNVPEGVTLAGNSATATEAGVKLVNGYIVLPETLFDALPDDAKKLRIEIKASKQASNWPENQWSERFFNFTSDNNEEDGVQVEGANGFGLSYNGNIGTTKAPYNNKGSYMDGALGGTNALGYNTMKTIKVEFDFATNTASLYVDGVLVKSAAATGDTLTINDFQKFKYNSIGRSYDMWSMWGFMTVESFSVSYGK